MKILIAEPNDFSASAIAILESFGSVTCDALSQKDVATALADYDAIWIRLGLTIRKKDLPHSPRCKFIISATTGLNHLDVQDLQNTGIKILSLKGQVQFLQTITATAEHTIGLLLSLVRMIPLAHTSVLQGNWDRDLFKGREISGKKVGILGYGRLGKIVTKYCKAFEMDVLVYDPFVTVSDHTIGSAESIEELFRSVDYVTIHIPLNESTQSLIGKELLGLMKSGSCLLNTSRGEILVEDDLLAALEEGTIAGAALDVLWNEEFLESNTPIIAYARTHRNLLLTPHIGGCTWDSMEKCEDFMAQMFFNSVIAK